MTENRSVAAGGRLQVSKSYDFKIQQKEICEVMKLSVLLVIMVICMGELYSSKIGEF